MAISKALRGHTDISAATRQRVVKLAAELGYQPNQVARQLASGQTRLVGMVVPTLAYSFFAQIAEGTARWLASQGYHLLLSSSQGDAAAEQELVRSFLAQRVDSLIIAPTGAMDSAGEFSYLDGCRVPFVLVGRGMPDSAVNFVGSDGIGIGRMAAEHLIAQGCRRIAYISGPPIAGSRQRETGYRAALEKQGRKADAKRIVTGGDSVEGGFEAARGLLRQPGRPDGIVCYNDFVAVGVMKAVLEAGLRIPEDVALTGVGNVVFSDHFRVPLTTLDQSPVDMGIQAAQLALRSIGHPASKPSRILIPVRLIERASSARRSGPLAAATVKAG